MSAQPCYFCDEFIFDPSTITYSTRGKPVCKGCRDEIDAHFSARMAADFQALAGVADPRESRASDLLRAHHVNFHG